MYNAGLPIRACAQTTWSRVSISIDIHTTDDAHAAAAFLRFCHEKMSANERKHKVAEDPAKHAPTPALHEYRCIMYNI